MFCARRLRVALCLRRADYLLLVALLPRLLLQSTIACSRALTRHGRLHIRVCAFAPLPGTTCLRAATCNTAHATAATTSPARARCRYKQEKLRFIWKEGSKYSSGDPGFYATIVVANTPNGLSKVEQKVGGSWKKALKLNELGQQWEMHFPDGVGGSGPVKDFELKVRCAAATCSAVLLATVFSVGAAARRHKAIGLSCSVQACYVCSRCPTSL